MSAKVKILRSMAAALLLAAALVVSAGCAAQQSSSSAGSASSASQQGSASAPDSGEYEKVLNPSNMVTTFIGEKFSDKKITNEDEALEAVKDAYGRIGADDTTQLELTAIRPTETGTTYYVFNQLAGDVFVHGASVKAIVDKDGTPLALTSAILPGVEMAKAEDWEVTAEQAEKIVLKECEEGGHAGVKVEQGGTEQTLIAIPNLAGFKYQYAWVVYTDNYDSASEMAYLAHYVDGSGDYLYALPISEPHNADAATGDKPNFDFGKYEQGTWKGTVTLHDGATKEIEVPVLIDKSDNSQILADGERKILCSDYAKWRFEETLDPRVSTESSFENTELLAYDTFIKVWDFYDSIGWKGPDGEGTATLLLMDYVDANGERQDNAAYAGRENGFQVFTFNRLNPDGENTDIIAHEFTHCVTTTTMTTNIYRNEFGAINEGMSDVLGNLVEMIIVNKPETAWLLGDSSGGGTLRSMKDPHEFKQPAFRWDTYYVPSVIKGTVTNDEGGAHTNSSLLNIVSYKLDQAGMQPAEQFYFWMNVALAMTPRTDYAQMAQLLPWCMEQSGYPQYVDALKKAIDETGYANLEEPSTPPAGSGKVTIEYSAEGLTDAGLVCFALSPADISAITSWPAADSNKAVFIVPAGDYAVTALIGAEHPNNCKVYLYDGKGWKLAGDNEAEADIIHVEEGKSIELSAQGLPESAEALG